MKERGILFSAPMVLAIGDDTKTQTRRLLKPQPTPMDPVGGERGWHWKCPRLDAGFCHTNESAFRTLAAMRSLYGVPGDRLWVRETLRQVKGGGAWTYGADGMVVALPKGDPRVGEMLSWAHHKEGDTCVSIHMPRWAARHVLEIVEVRVERLQDITTDDVIAEGVAVPTVDYGVPEDPRQLDAERDEEARRLFAALWDSINGDRAPWDSNPWVWALTLERVLGGVS